MLSSDLLRLFVSLVLAGLAGSLLFEPIVGGVFGAVAVIVFIAGTTLSA